MQQIKKTPSNIFSPTRHNKQLFINEIYSPYHNSVQKYEKSELLEKFPELKQFNDYLYENISLKRLYEMVIENQQNHSYYDAIFFADKLLTLLDGHPVIVYILAQCYFFNQDYKKVHSLFVKYNLLTYNINFQVLAARSCLKNKQYDLCQNILDMTSDKTYQNIQLEAQKFLMKAQCFEASENKQSAINCYRECLLRDPTCIEAYNRMIDCYLLTNHEKEDLLMKLNFNQEDSWIKSYYLARIQENFQLTTNQSKNKQQQLNSSPINPGLSGTGNLPHNSNIGIISPNPSLLNNNNNHNKKSFSIMESEENLAGSIISNNNNNNNILGLSSLNKQQIQMNVVKDLKSDNLFETLNNLNNIDILCIKAKNAHQKYDIYKAYEICVKAIKEDPLYFNIIPIYTACLLDLGYLGELYYCAHNLIENYSQHPLSWFAIGSYYYLTKKFEIARKYFQKSIILDRNFIYSWIGMAHSFAIQDESDQAMSVYRTVSRLFPGCYIAHLNMGMEYLRTNNLKTAILSFKQAEEINASDPLIFNEIGVIYFKQKQYELAKQTFLTALKQCEDATHYIIETILTNLAHCYRKVKDYKNATKYYEKCITLNSKNPQTYFSLAYTYHIKGELEKAICYYHKSLHYKNDNQFAHDMLQKCLSDAVELPWETVYKNI